MTMGRTLLFVGVATAGATAYGAYKFWRLLSYYEAPFNWLGSIIPPRGYDHKEEDTATTRALVAAQHPELLDMVDRGTLDVLVRPPNYDRPLPEEVYILGTAHVSRQTADDVFNCIMSVQPEAVVVELCRGRSFMMFREAKQSKEAPKGSVAEAKAIFQACQQSQNILQVLIGWLYYKVEDKMQITAGLEFIKARQAIDLLSSGHGSAIQQQQQAPQPNHALRKVQVYFGDVGIQQTVSRSWGVLSVHQKLKLIWALMRDLVSLDVDEEDIESLLKEDVHEMIQRVLGPSFAPMLGPLLHERNWNIARTVHCAADHGNTKKVVVVVGKGHVPGVVYCLMHPWRVRLRHRAWKQQQQQNQH